MSSANDIENRSSSVDVLELDCPLQLLYTLLSKTTEKSLPVDKLCAVRHSRDLECVFRCILVNNSDIKYQMFFLISYQILSLIAYE